MTKCNALSQKDNKCARKEYEKPKCVTCLMAIDILTSSIQGEENGYTWTGNNWSEVLENMLFE